jgi:hypothetical protein
MREMIATDKNYSQRYCKEDTNQYEELAAEGTLILNSILQSNM